MRIATFNVNNVNKRLPSLLKWLAATKPDVACLQELKCEDHAFPEGEIRKAGYHALWKGQRSWNGVAILSLKKPKFILDRLPGDPSDLQSRYIEAEVGGTVIGCIYLPNGNPQPGPKFDYKLAWFKRLHTHARKLLKSGQPVVLAGDYNVVPTDRDIYRTTSWADDALLQPESRAAYAKLLKQGWTDSIRHLHPDDAPYTFWTYWRNRWQRNDGLRIDHLLVTPDLVSRLKGAGVDRDVRGWQEPSDHAPAWIQLKRAVKPSGHISKLAVVAKPSRLV